jgi:hypothetical protein
MQIRKIIEHKYSYSHPKICRNHKERKEGVFYSFLQNQERNIKISRTRPRLRVYRWNKHLWARD